MSDKLQFAVWFNPRNAVSATCVSGWVNHSRRELSDEPTRLRRWY